MNETSSIEQLIADELQAQVETAVPPCDAWDRFIASIDPPGISDSGEADVHEAANNNLTVDHLERQRQHGTAPGARRRRSGVLVGVAATILVVVGIFLVADTNRGDVVMTDRAPSPTVADPAPAANESELTVLPSVLDPVSRYRWSRVAASDPAGFGEEFEQGISSVTVGGPGLVAVGQADGPAVWASPDGITWSQPPGNDTVFNIDGVMASVTVGGPGLVAVGRESDEGDPGADAAAVWTSIDGLTWSRVPHDESIFGGAFMRSVAVGGPGLVAVGRNGHPHVNEGDAVVWTSVDGLTWSRVPHDESVFGEQLGASMESLTAGGPGLVAVGFVTVGPDGNERPNAAVWTSPDGFTWSRVAHSDAVFGGGWMRSVTAGGPGLVAVGADAAGAAVWTSPDGLTWSRFAQDEAAFGGGEMGGVTTGGPGLVAVGADAAGAAVWTSPDGINWSRVIHDDAVFGAQPKPILEIRDVIAGGPGLVAVGANGMRDTFGATDSDAAVWVATPEG